MVSIIIIKEERNREAYTKTSVFFFIQKIEEEKCIPIDQCFFLFRKKKKRSIDQDQISIIAITEERRRIAHILSSVFFYYRRQKKTSTHQNQVSIIVITEERSREAYTKTIVLFFFSKKEKEKHTPGPGKYYCYYRR
jgi:cbb3-type cytochrome oxidase subunit 3